MRARFICIGLLVLGLLLPGFLATKTSAQSEPAGVSITTSPLPTSLRTDPGKPVSTELKVQNSGKETIPMKVTLLKFTANNDLGQPKLADRAPEDGYFDWVHFSESTFKAEPGVWKTVKMTINVPADAGLGYYYAVVFSKDDPSKPINSQTSIQGAAAILVLLDVKSPNEKRLLDLADFRTSHRSYEFLPASFSLTLKNKGNIFLAPSGSIFIYRGNKQLATIDVNPGHGNILPGTNRIYTVSWDDGFPAYKEKMVNGKPITTKDGNVRQLTWDFDSPLSKFRFGRYKARLVAVYDDGQRDVPLEATVTFWVIPWRFILGFIAVLALIAFLIYRSIRLRRRLKRLLADQGKHKQAHKPKDEHESDGSSDQA